MAAARLGFVLLLGTITFQISSLIPQETKSAGELYGVIASPAHKSAGIVPNAVQHGANGDNIAMVPAARGFEIVAERLRLGSPTQPRHDHCIVANPSVRIVHRAASPSRSEQGHFDRKSACAAREVSPQRGTQPVMQILRSRMAITNSGFS